MLSSLDLLQEYCKTTGKFAVFYSGWWNFEPLIGCSKDESEKFHEELHKALIFLDKTHPNYAQVFIDGEGFSVFDTEEECENFYDLIVGYDGPTKSNPYDGPIKVYALTCGPNGFMAENT